jgi:hypothetical protein
MMKFLQIIFHCVLVVVYCALVVMFHELDRTIPISAALILAIPCTAVICAPLLLLPRRRPPLFDERRDEGGTGHVLPGSGGTVRAAPGIVLDGSYKRIAVRALSD